MGVEPIASSLLKPNTRQPMVSKFLLSGHGHGHVYGRLEFGKALATASSIDRPQAMSKRLGGRRALLGALFIGVAACNLDPGLPGRNGNAAPVNSAVTLSGAGAPDNSDAVGSGEGSRITDIKLDHGQEGSPRASADCTLGGADSGGAFDESTDHTGGTAATGAGGRPGVGGRAGAGAGGRAGADGAGGTLADDSASGGAAGSSATDPIALWFSEYIEGSSSNKALEITAQARSGLDGCKVGTYFNGKTEATVVATLSGVLEAGQVLTLCTSSLKEKLGAVCTQVGNLTFNGDDAVSLSCDGTLMDVIGQVGVDPGDAWGSATNSTAEHTLRRKCSVQTGDRLPADAFDPGLEWQAFPIDTFDGLGAPGC